MQANLLNMAEAPVDYSRSKVLVPLSGGINSAAVLCALGEHYPAELKPLELHLYYSHLKEHSPDTFPFVADLIRYARRRFVTVKATVTRASVNKFFLKENFIPHPTISPCSEHLKFGPMQRYDVDNQIDLVLIGFVKHEFRRYARAQRRSSLKGRTKDCYPLLSWSDDDCFAIVKEVIGWYPAIYDIRWTEQDASVGLCRSFEVGRRVFTHNNCLPCKNMTSRQFQMVGRHFPKHAQTATEIAAQIPGAYWGRDDVPDVFKCDKCERLSG
jgi:3'-phosphoadenosine 5'-phosphosulfate sulfotransferase (PAPS reductase)/FAD synthetase